MELNKCSEADEQLDAQAHIWNHIFNFINSMSLKCAVELGIPDIVYNHGKPMALCELIIALPINPSKEQYVYRLMRILIHSGFFLQQEIEENNAEKGFLLTPAGKLLLTDHPWSVSPLLLSELDPTMTSPFDHLSEWFRSNDLNPFLTTHGMTLWDKAGQDSRLNRLLNEEMASDARLVGTLFTKSYRNVFDGVGSMVDVGGGTGTMAKAIADAFPNMKCAVLDLPHVVNGLEGSQNMAYIEGDMFDSIPPANAVLLKWILHDWSDEECVKILEKCKEAIPCKEKGGKVIIIEMVVDNKKGNHVAFETQLFYDMLMMVHVNGKERTEEEWAKLFFEAGFNDYKLTSLLGLRSLIEVYY